MSLGKPRAIFPVTHMTVPSLPVLFGFFHLVTISGQDYLIQKLHRIQSQGLSHMWEAEEGRGRVERVGKGLLHLHGEVGGFPVRPWLSSRETPRKKKKKKKKTNQSSQYCSNFPAGYKNTWMCLGSVEVKKKCQVLILCQAQSFLARNSARPFA